LRRNPHLVVVSLSAYGATGPLGGEPGHDINAQALAGIVALTGPSPRPPPVQSADVAAALYVVVAVLAALRKPEGGWLDLSMADAALSLNGLAVAAAHAGAPPRADSTVLHGGFPGYAVYPAKDGRFLALGVLEPAHWTDLVGRLGLGAEATREDFARRLLERSLPEWMIALRGLPVCEAVSPADAASEPQFRARGARGRPADPLGLPSLRPAPRLGAHTGPVLSELGYDAEAVRRLSGAGVVRLGNP
jgi:crotonobetainyl-CoA:carnitine CoA-transferase CaiB-like acyl-CoA transferase